MIYRNTQLAERFQQRGPGAVFFVTHLENVKCDDGIGIRVLFL